MPEFLLIPYVGADFWNISELADKAVVRARIVRVILEWIEPDDEIFFRGILFFFLTDGSRVLEGCGALTCFTPQLDNAVMNIKKQGKCSKFS